MYMTEKIYSCKKCRRPIMFIKTANGASMPVDSVKVDILPDPDGKDIGYYDERINTASGFVNLHTKGKYVNEPCEGSERVYRPHWGFCGKQKPRIKAQLTPERATNTKRGQVSC